MEIGSNGSVQSDIQQIMERIKNFSEQRQINISAPSKDVKAAGGFDSIMSKAESMIDQVNHLKSFSDKTSESWVTGTGNVSVSEVVVAAEKSRLAMEGLITVRNKVLEAYREIMNMQV